MRMLGTELGFSARAVMILTTEASLQPLSIWVVVLLFVTGSLYVALAISELDIYVEQARL